jgi:hypothetical protein
LDGGTRLSTNCGIRCAATALVDCREMIAARCGRLVVHRATCSAALQKHVSAPCHAGASTFWRWTMAAQLLECTFVPVTGCDTHKLFRFQARLRGCRPCPEEPLGFAPGSSRLRSLTGHLLVLLLRQMERG